MHPEIITTEKDYYLALERFDEIFSAKKGTKDSDEADLLALQIGTYEQENFPKELV